MNKYNLTIFSPSGNINTSIIANYFVLSESYISFYDENKNFICGFPSRMTAIISVVKDEQNN